MTPDLKQAAERYRHKVMNLIKGDLFAGSGFGTLLYPPAYPTDLEGDDVDVDAIPNATQAMSIVHDWRSLPKVSIFELGNSRFRLSKIIGEGIGETTFERFVEYMEVNRLAVIPIIGFAGSGKTQMISHVAFLVLQSVGALYCAAPTHVATSNFAERLFHLGTTVSKELGWNVPLVVRGYRIKKELEAFETLTFQTLAGNIADPYTTARWDIRLSLCEWLLKVVEAPGYRLAEKDPQPLHALRQAFRAQDQYSNLRLFVQRKIGSFSTQPEGTADPRSPSEVAVRGRRATHDPHSQEGPCGLHHPAPRQPGALSPIQ